MKNSILVGDVRKRGLEIPDNSLNCVVTSPPYYNLRNYNNAAQIGLESTPEAYVAELVEVFRDVRRALRKDGTLWLNLGDSYAGSGMGKQGRHAEASACPDNGSKNKAPGLKAKDLIGIPWTVAFALRADGWYLRSEIIWHKRNPMPDSTKDRPTKAHETLFLLSKSSSYFYDADAIAEPVADATSDRCSSGKAPRFGGTKYGDDGAEIHRTKSGNSYRPQLARAYEIAKEKGLTQAHIDAIRSVGMCDAGKAQVTQTGFGKNTPAVMELAAEAKEALNGYYREFLSGLTRNRRTVWTLGSQPYKGAHFATFPPKLVEPCILAGCPDGGLVYDPFGGAMTTAMVAQRLGRNFLACELNPDYAEMGRQRVLYDNPMFNECTLI